MKNLFHTVFFLVFFFSSAQAADIKIRTINYEATIEPISAEITSIKLNNYREKDLSSDLFSILDKSKGIYLNSSYFTPSKSVIPSAYQHYTINHNGPVTELVFSAQSPEFSITKTIRFNNDNNYIYYNNAIKNLSSENVEISLQNTIHHSSDAHLPTFLKPFYGFILYDENNHMKKIRLKSLQDTSFTSQSSPQWFAYRDQFFLTAWSITNSPNQQVYSKYEDDIYSLTNSTQLMNVTSNKDIKFESLIYVGPLSPVTLLTPAKISHLESSLDYGFLYSISSFLLKAIVLIHNFIGNWGFSIIVFTILLRALLFPITKKSAISMYVLNKLKPEIEKIKNNYSEPQAKILLNELTEEYKINPLLAIIPSLLQIPLFIAIYWMLATFVDLRHSHFMFWITDLSAKDHLYVLPAILFGLLYFQSKQGDTPKSEMMALLKATTPYTLTFIFTFMPAGLLLYMITNNLMTFLINRYIANKCSQITEFNVESSPSSLLSRC